MLDEALRQCGGTRFAMIGDASFDVLAARAAEVPCVAYTPGYHDMPVADLGADALIDHYDELVGVLERL